MFVPSIDTILYSSFLHYFFLNNTCIKVAHRNAVLTHKHLIMRFSDHKFNSFICVWCMAILIFTFYRDYVHAKLAKSENSSWKGYKRRLILIFCDMIGTKCLIICWVANRTQHLSALLDVELKEDCWWSSWRYLSCWESTWETPDINGVKCFFFQQS